ncbi:phage/plasmid primase, P4 family [Clostridium thailandense]|uniref:DNA primase family protein n=1 Tax=Clostridium thailandense TaxID=2794346 RepID=UPI003988F16A
MSDVLDRITANKRNKKKKSHKNHKFSEYSNIKLERLNTLDSLNSSNIGRDYTIKKENIKKLMNNEIAEDLCNKHSFIYLKGALYYYNNIIYTKLDKHTGISLLKELLPSGLVKSLSSYDYAEILSQIKTNPSIQRNEDNIKDQDHLICFKNGIYDLKKEKLKPHTSKNYFFSYINLDYDPENIGSGHVFEKYLDTCACSNKKIKKLLLEMLGYIISNSMHAEKIFFILGIQNSGKTTLGNFIQHLIGRENCCNIQPQDFSKRFQTSQLLGKKLCFNMELLDSPIKETGLLKQLSGGDMITAEYKNENSFSFKNQAKLLYGCNNLPRVNGSENAKAFFSRLIIIPFNYSVPPEEQNKNLIRDLIKESNYIVHKSIIALKELYENNHIFTTCNSIEKIKNEFIESQNNVIEFVNHKCIIDAESKIHSETLYNSYIKFCKENSYTEFDIVNLSRFSYIIANNFNLKKKKWRPQNATREDSSKNGFIGIALKS